MFLFLLEHQISRGKNPFPIFHFSSFSTHLASRQINKIFPRFCSIIISASVSALLSNQKTRLEKILQLGLGNKVQMQLSERRGLRQKIFIPLWLNIKVQGKYNSSGGQIVNCILRAGEKYRRGRTEGAGRKKIVGTATTKCNGQQHPTCWKFSFCDCCWWRRPGNGTAGFYWTSASLLVEEYALPLYVPEFQWVNINTSSLASESCKYCWISYLWCKNPLWILWNFGKWASRCEDGFVERIVANGDKKRWSVTAAKRQMAGILGLKWSSFSTETFERNFLKWEKNPALTIAKCLNSRVETFLVSYGLALRGKKSNVKEKVAENAIWRLERIYGELELVWGGGGCPLGSEIEGLKLWRTEVEGGKMRGEADPAGMSTIHKFRARTSPLPRPLLETFSVSEYCLHSQKLSCLSPPTNTRESNTNICDGVFDSNMAGGCWKASNTHSWRGSEYEHSWKNKRLFPES